jgi:glycine betaine/proline transport system ATP-binding protein
MALIQIRGLSTVFGPDPGSALARVHQGMDKATLLDHGHTLGLHDVNLDIEAGEIFVIMGLSGSGKSTLVRHVNRLIDPTVGQVLIDGQDITALPAPALVDLRRQRLGMVFQHFGLLAHRRVIDNVAFGLELRGVTRAERHARAQHWIERVSLAGYEQHLPVQLSGGMQQRVGLARALCSDTDIILMDEAFSAVDPLIRSQLQAELLKLQAELGRTIVFVTHDLDEALRLGSRVAILRDGRVEQVGSPTDLLTRPANEHVAAFVRDVNRARALRISVALAPWPADCPWPALDKAVDAESSIEQVLPRLVGRSTPLAVRRGDTLIGQVSPDAVREVLAQQD